MWDFLFWPAIALWWWPRREVWALHPWRRWRRRGWRRGRGRRSAKPFFNQNVDKYFCQDQVQMFIFLSRFTISLSLFLSSPHHHQSRWLISALYRPTAIPSPQPSIENCLFSAQHWRPLLLPTRRCSPPDCKRICVNAQSSSRTHASLLPYSQTGTNNTQRGTTPTFPLSYIRCQRNTDCHCVGVSGPLQSICRPRYIFSYTFWKLWPPVFRFQFFVS